MSSLIAIRHPPVREEGVCYGTSDVACEPVEAHLGELLGLLSGYGIRSGQIWSSPAVRCTDVAGRLGEHFGANVHIDGRLSEICFGDWEGRRWADIERDDPRALSHWMRHWHRVAPPGGETVSALEVRVQAFVIDVRNSAHDTSLVVTHAGVIRALYVVCLGWSWDDAMARSVPCMTPIDIPIAAKLLFPR